MKAIGITKRPEIGNLAQCIQVLDVPLPTPRPDEVLVEVAASSITIDDIHIAEGTFIGGLPLRPKPTADKPVVPGADLSGVVRAVGAKVTRFQVGDVVFGVASPIRRRTGTWSECCCTKESMLFHKPAAYSHAEAAVSGLAGLVACDTVKRGNLQKGQTGVVIGASGGIGSLVTQLLATAGVEVIGVCSGRNAEMAQNLGASRVIDYRTESIVEALRREYSPGVDAVFDCVGGRDMEAIGMQVLNPSGTFVTVAGPERFLGDTYLGLFGVARVLGYILRRTLASSLRGPKYRMANPGKQTFTHFREMLLAHNIKPQIERVAPLEPAAMAEAISLVASHRARGRVVVQVSGQF